MKQDILKLFSGEAHKVTFEKPSEMAASFFKETYAKALACLSDIMNQNEVFAKDNKLPEFNNVIAFTGERGSGKSSSMLNFCNLLKDWELDCDGGKKGQELAKAIHGAGDELPRDAKFLCLDSVDPSRFEPYDRLVGTILAELYRRYLELSNAHHKCNHKDQVDLENAFTAALKAVQMLSNKDASPFGVPGAAESEFAILKRIADGVSMRELFHKLVQAFLKYKFGSVSTKHYLVIPIDDLDMSVQHAYTLAEDIRKYLLVPNVIIPIAMKLDQLRMAVEQANVERFKEYRLATQHQQPSMDEIETMSNLYMEKLVPTPRVIVMPEVASVKAAKTTKLIFGKRVEIKDQTEAEKSIEQYVVAKVSKKTGIYLMVKEKEIHPFIPGTLRELHNLLEWLDSLPDFEFTPETLNNPKGLREFLQYLKTKWVPSVLRREDEDEYAKILDGDPTQAKLDIIKLIRKHIEEVSQEAKKLWDNTSIERSSNPYYQYKRLPSHLTYMGADIVTEQITLGDLIWHFYELQKIDNSKETRSLLFALKFYLTSIIQIDLLENAIPKVLPSLVNAIPIDSFYHSPFPGYPYAGIDEKSSEFLISNKSRSGEPKVLIEWIMDFAWDKTGKSKGVKISERFNNPDFTRLVLAITSFINWTARPWDDINNNWTNAYFYSTGGGKAVNYVFGFWSFLYWSVNPIENLHRFLHRSIRSQDLPPNSPMVSLSFLQFFQIEFLETLSRLVSQSFARFLKGGGEKSKERSLRNDVIRFLERFVKIGLRLTSGWSEKKAIFEISYDANLNSQSFVDACILFLGLTKDDVAIFIEILEGIDREFLAGGQQAGIEGNREAENENPILAKLRENFSKKNGPKLLGKEVDRLLNLASLLPIERSMLKSRIDAWRALPIRHKDRSKLRTEIVAIARVAIQYLLKK